MAQRRSADAMRVVARAPERVLHRDRGGAAHAADRTRAALAARPVERVGRELPGRVRDAGDEHRPAVLPDLADVHLRALLVDDHDAGDALGIDDSRWPRPPAPARCGGRTRARGSSRSRPAARSRSRRRPASGRRWRPGLRAGSVTLLVATMAGGAFTSPVVGGAPSDGPDGGERVDQAGAVLVVGTRGAEIVAPSR